MDRNDNFSDEDQSHEDQSHEDHGIIELTDILDEIVDGDGKADQSPSTVMSEKGMARDHDSILSDDAVEAALLRIVEKKYARQLDALFVEAVERVVKREIAAIKQSLLKDL
jgi:hypothetical protein